MRRALFAIVLSAAALLVWLAAHELPWAVRAWTVFLLVALPALLVAQTRALGHLEELPRTEVYVSSIVSLWGLAALTLLAARVSGIGLVELGLVGAGAGAVVAWTAGTVAAAFGLIFVARALGVTESPIVALLLPRTRRERLVFALLSVTAGICEELVFRGFLLPVLADATGSLALALVLSSGVFGIMHAYQQPAGAARATLLGMLLAIPFLATGSLLPSILAHAGIDLLAGLVLRDRLLR